MIPGQSAASKPTLYLHIGSPKTGTSAIQAFLSLNREAFFAATGLYYAESDSDNRVRKGKPTTGNGGKIAQLLRSRRRETLDQAIALTERELDHGRDKLLLSSEAFWSVPTETLAAFMRRLEPRTGFRFLFYARPQVRHVESAYLQVLGNGRFGGGVGEYFDAMKDKFFIGSKLERLRELAPADAITARKYDRKALIGGDVIDDVLHVFGATRADGFNRPVEVNTSLDAEHYLYARATAGALPVGATAKKTMRNFGQDPMFAAWYAQAQPIAGLQVMDPATARRVRDTFHEDNELLDRLAPDVGFGFNADNDKAVLVVEEAAQTPASGLSRLELLLLGRLAQLEARVAQLSGGTAAGADVGDDDED
jgi:hypothetical protein